MAKTTSSKTKKTENGVVELSTVTDVSVSDTNPIVTVSAEEKKLQDQNAELMNMILALKKEIETLKQAPTQQDEQTELLKSLIPKKKRYTIVNTYDGIVGISYQERGIPQVLSKTGDRVSVKEEELDTIWRLNKKAFLKGHVIFEEQEAYDYLGISYIQQEVMDKNTIERLYALNLKDLENLYNRVNLSCKRLIVDKFVNENIKKNGDIRYNDRDKIELLSRLSNSDLSTKITSNRNMS